MAGKLGGIVTNLADHRGGGKTSGDDLYDGTGGDGPGDGGDDMLRQRVHELERNFLHVSVNIASMKAKLDDMPSKDWVHLRLWAVAGAIVAAVGLMIMFLPAAR